MINKIAENLKTQLLEEIEKALGNKKLYKIWFSKIEILQDDKGNIQIPIKSSYKDYFETNFRKAIEECIKKVFGSNVSLKIISQSTIPWETAAQNKKSKATNYTISFKLNEDYTFDNFIVGRNNRHAYTLSRAVANNPLESCSPLFIYGGVGLGKTHLLHAIIHSIMNSHPKLSCLYISCENFINHYIDAIRKNTIDSFRNFIRNVDILAVDDIHFLSNKESSQEEFFHTFNALYHSRKMIILSSDCSPKEINAIKEQLVSRFLWGQVAHIEPPDHETILAILENKCKKYSIKLTDELKNILASTITSNIREIEGILNTLKHLPETNKPITLEMAKNVLKSFLPSKQKFFTPLDIANAVCSHFNISLKDLKSQKRSHLISLARQLTVYLLKQHTAMNLQEIGSFLGGRNHSTIIYSYEKISKQVTTKEELITTLKHVEKLLKNKTHSHF